MRGFIIGTVATAITFWIVAYLLESIDYGGDLVGLAILAVIAGIVNGLIKPIVKLFSLPLTVMTLGLFGLVINAGMLLLIAWLSDLVGLTFSVGGFPPDLSIDALVAALIGGIAITIVGSIVGLVVHD
jgi:putative membrane protein